MKTRSGHINSGHTCRTALSLVTVATLAVLATGTTSSSSDVVWSGLEGRAPTQEELRPSVEAAFSCESYAPGAPALLTMFNKACGVAMQLFRVGPEAARTMGNSEMQGVPVGGVVRLGCVSKGRTVTVHVPGGPSGLYFARLTAADGRVGFAPFVLGPHRLGEHRVAVVLPTLTWQAYNLRDDDGDGKGDSWYANWDHLTVRLGRPFLNRGVPYNFRAYDLPFLHWLARNGYQVDYLADADLERAASGGALAAAYDLIVFPGHHEYVTTHEYDVVQGYRDLGGNLMFLSANNFFWRVLRVGNTIVKTQQWRDLGRPEAALIGVMYRGNDSGQHRGAWILQPCSGVDWVFAGTKLRPGSSLSNAGIEIDKTAPSSPRGVKVLAQIPDLFGPGFTAQMTYYETPRGARVFAAGAFTLAGSVDQPDVARVMANIWAHMTER